MLLTYEQHSHLWKSRADLERVLLDKAKEEHRKRRDIDELGKLYMRFVVGVPAIVHNWS